MNVRVKVFEFLFEIFDLVMLYIQVVFVILVCYWKLIFIYM